MIIINARFLTQQTTGVQRFAIEISKQLKKSSLPIEFVAPKNILQTQIAKTLEVKTDIPFSFLKGHLWEQIALRNYILQKNALLISLCNTGPVFLKNQIITIHDLGFKIHPEWYSKIFTIFYNIVIPKLSLKAKHILTVSQASKDEIVRELNVPKEKVTVVYNAVSEVFNDRSDFLVQNPTNEEFLTKDFILTVSSLNPRKNFKRLIEAFLKINKPDMFLYIVGNVNKHFSEVNISDSDSSRIKFFNNITDMELALFYQNTKLFVYPSLYEGFGIPIIEAASQGAKVCVSDIPVFREICGEGVLFFDPENVNDICDKIKTALALDDKTKNPINLKNYNWNSSAKIIERSIFDVIKKNL